MPFVPLQQEGAARSQGFTPIAARSQGFTPIAIPLEYSDPPDFIQEKGGRITTPQDRSIDIIVDRVLSSKKQAPDNTAEVSRFLQAQNTNTSPRISDIRAAREATTLTPERILADISSSGNNLPHIKNSEDRANYVAGIIPGIAETIGGGAADFGGTIASGIGGMVYGALPAVLGGQKINWSDPNNPFYQEYAKEQGLWSRNISPVLAPQTEVGKDIMGGFADIASKMKSAGETVTDITGSEEAGAWTEAGLQTLAIPLGFKALGAVPLAGSGVAAMLAKAKRTAGAPSGAATVKGAASVSDQLNAIRPLQTEQQGFTPEQPKVPTPEESAQMAKDAAAYRKLQEDIKEGAPPTEEQPVTPPPGSATFAPKPGDVPTAPRHAVAGVPIVRLPLSSLRLSKDVPQFKKGANEEGIVEPLGGTYDEVGATPVQIWERMNGNQEIISGRHRVDLARRSKKETISSQIHREADGFDKVKAATLDAILNIRDGQGGVSDYANFFRNSGITEQDANSEGLLARAKGKAGWSIARDAGENVYESHSAGIISDEAALAFSRAAPKDATSQAVGLKMINEGKSINQAENTIRAIVMMQKNGEVKAEQGDMFGFDDSAIRQAEDMAKNASAAQRAIREQLAAVAGAIKRPEIARKLGVDVKDPASVKAKIEQLRSALNRLASWPLYPDLVKAFRGEEEHPPSEKSSDELIKEANSIEDELRSKFGKDERGNYRTELWIDDPLNKNLDRLRKYASTAIDKERAALKRNINSSVILLDSNSEPIIDRMGNQIQLGGKVSTEDILLQLSNELEADNYSDFAFRVVEEAYAGVPEVGDKLINSKVWKQPNQEDFNDYFSSDEDAGNISGLEPTTYGLKLAVGESTASYPGHFVIIMKGKASDLNEHNIDIGEVTLEDATIVSVYARKIPGGALYEIKAKERQSSLPEATSPTINSGNLKQEKIAADVGAAHGQQDSLEQPENRPTVAEAIANSRQIGESAKAETVDPTKNEDSKISSFLDGLPPMQKKNGGMALETSVLFHNKPISRANLVEQMVAEGAEVVAHDKDVRRLQKPDGAFIEQARLTKTGMDYAEHLIAKKSQIDNKQSAIAQDSLAENPAERRNTTERTAMYDLAKGLAEKIGNISMSKLRRNYPQFNEMSASRIIAQLEDDGVIGSVNIHTGRYELLKGKPSAETTEAKPSEAKQPEEPAKPVEAKLSIGRMPKSAEPVTVRDGKIFIGEDPATNYETGEDVPIHEDATPQEIKYALSEAGAIGSGHKIFGLKAPEAKVAAETKEKPVSDTVKRIMAERDRAESSGKNEPPEEFPSVNSIVNMNIGITLQDIARGVGQVARDAKAVVDRAKATKLGAAASEWMDAIKHDIQIKIVPMATGTDRAMAIAKDFANADRMARWQWEKFDSTLKDNFTPEQRQKMWDAADEEDQMRRNEVHEDQRKGKGLDSLAKDERDTMDTLTKHGENILQRARDVGMFKGDGVDYWVPRMVAMIGEDGTISMPKDKGGAGFTPYSSPTGGNISTKAGSLKARKHATTEETEAAAKARFGEGAQVVRDIRTMPMAMARIERAIATRELIDQIKSVGEQTGQELVKSGEPRQEAKAGFFTIDHPAFKIYRYRPDVVQKEAFDKLMVNKLNQFASDIGVSHERVARIGGNIWGKAEMGGDRIKSRFGGPETVITHEIGHQLDHKYGLKEKFVNAKNTKKELRALADLRYEGAEDQVSNYFKKYVREGSEKIANMVHAYVHMPERFKEVAPNSYAEFTSFLKEHPELNGLNEIKPSLRLGTGSISKRPPGEDFDIFQVFVSKEFEGPLKSIMTDKPGNVYQAFMNMKGKSMSVIMYSPLIHNGVEWGRALPLMPGRIITFKAYYDGNVARNNPAVMHELINDGMVPIGHRFFMQDISGIMEEPTLKPGRSWTAQILGGATGLVSKKAGEAVKKGIDNAGDFWHNTLLWDRIGDLQAGIAVNMKSDLIKKGMDPQTAGRVAAHLANRYAGALPNEAMSANARKVANFMFFSRTFTIGNLGVMKDMISGLPKDVQAQILRDAGPIAAFAAKGAAQKAAIKSFAVDIALMYAANSALQTGFDSLKRDKSLDEIEREYVERFNNMLAHEKENPSDLLKPFGMLESLTPMYANEPGKEQRVLYDYDKTGTAIYVRLPTGKIGEEFLSWTTSPLDILKRKEGTVARPIIQMLTNDRGYGRKVYDDNLPGYKGAFKAAGNIAWNFLSQQFPVDSLNSALDIARHQSDENDALKVIGPLFGLTFSKGAPGGPEVGMLYTTERMHRAEISDAMPDIKRYIKQGNMEDAVKRMYDAHMTPQEIRATIKFSMMPRARLTPQKMKQFFQTASPEQKQKMKDIQESRP